MTVPGRCLTVLRRSLLASSRSWRWSPSSWGRCFDPPLPRSLASSGSGSSSARLSQRGLWSARRLHLRSSTPCRACWAPSGGHCSPWDGPDPRMSRSARLSQLRRGAARSPTQEDSAKVGRRVGRRRGRGGHPHGSRVVGESVGEPSWRTRSRWRPRLLWLRSLPTCSTRERARLNGQPSSCAPKSPWRPRLRR